MCLVSDSAQGWRQVHPAGTVDRSAAPRADSSGPGDAPGPPSWTAPLRSLLSEQDSVRVVDAVLQAPTHGSWSALVALRPQGDLPSLAAQASVSYGQDTAGNAVCTVLVRPMFVSEASVPAGNTAGQLLDFVESACEFGIIEYEPDAGLVHLDESAARLHQFRLQEQVMSIPPSFLDIAFCRRRSDACLHGAE